MTEKTMDRFVGKGKTRVIAIYDRTKYTFQVYSLGAVRYESKLVFAIRGGEYLSREQLMNERM